PGLGRDRAQDEGHRALPRLPGGGALRRPPAARLRARLREALRGLPRARSGGGRRELHAPLRRRPPPPSPTLLARNMRGGSAGAPSEASRGALGLVVVE